MTTSCIISNTAVTLLHSHTHAKYNTHSPRFLSIHADATTAITIGDYKHNCHTPATLIYILNSLLILPLYSVITAMPIATVYPLKWRYIPCCCALWPFAEQSCLPAGHGRYIDMCISTYRHVSSIHEHYSARCLCVCVYACITHETQRQNELYKQAIMNGAYRDICMSHTSHSSHSNIGMYTPCMK